MLEAIQLPGPDPEKKRRRRRDPAGRIPRKRSDLIAIEIIAKTTSLKDAIDACKAAGLKTSKPRVSHFYQLILTARIGWRPCK